MKKLYILGDSHAHQLSIAFRLAKFQGFKEAGIDIEFRLFGAVKQGIRHHHRVNGSKIDLLEDNWEQKVLPFDASDLNNPDVCYAISLPFNITPMLRQIEFARLTTDPKARRKQFLSAALVGQLVKRRSSLGVDLAKDMKAIGINTIVIESPRPFEDNAFAPENPDMLETLVSAFFEQTRSELVSNGIPTLVQPASTMDAKGLFTLAELNSGDQQHAKTEYYQCMIENILEYSKAV